MYIDDLFVSIICVACNLPYGLCIMSIEYGRKSSEPEIEYETILSPTVIPCDEFEKYRESLPYYKNIEQEGIELYSRKE